MGLGDGIPRPLFGTPIGDWHRWFAWKPVRTWDHRLVWLRMVRRQSVQLKFYLHGGPDWWWRYDIGAR
jgi:hypothetical protein